VGAELANADRARDDMLMRHIYDLNLICDHYDYSQVATLTRAIMLADAQAWNQFPAYRENPMAETLRPLTASTTIPPNSQRYDESPKHGLWATR
jgi:hypothetical protein